MDGPKISSKFTKIKIIRIYTIPLEFTECQDHVVYL